MANNPSTNKSENPLDNNAQLKAFFNTLPPSVQENMKQTGVQMHSVEELRQCAEHLMQGQ